MNPIILVFIIAAMLALSYKVYLQDKLSGKSSTAALFGLMRRIFGITYLLPISKTKYAATYHSLIKTANLALIIFWSCFVIAITLGAVDAF